MCRAGRLPGNHPAMSANCYSVGKSTSDVDANDVTHLLTPCDKQPNGASHTRALSILGRLLRIMTTNLYLLKALNPT